MELNLEPLVEFHSEENAEIIAELAPDIVGVNCRDLNSMTSDITFFQKYNFFISIQLYESSRKWDLYIERFKIRFRFGL